MNPHCSFLIFGIVFAILLGSAHSRQLPVQFFSLYDIPDEFYRDAYYKQKKSAEEIKIPQPDINSINENKLIQPEIKPIYDGLQGYITENRKMNKIRPQLPGELEIMAKLLSNNIDRNGIKDRTAKKNNNNNYYMSVCHFKICNMGRKRNARHIQVNPDLLSESKKK